MQKSLSGFLLTVLWSTQFYTQVLGAEACSERQLDIIFLIDGSRSVRANNFETVKNYVRNFTKTFSEVGPNATQIGVIQFASSIREEISLGQYSNRESLLQAIDNINYMRMGTMTGEALKYLVGTALKPSHGSRLGQDGVRTVALVITDGKSQDYHRGTLSKWQRKAKDLGVEFYAIGVGRGSNEKELLEIASEPKLEHKFYTNDFDGIQSIALQLRDLDICDFQEVPILTLTDPSLSSLTAEWNPINSQALTGYKITYYKVGENGQKVDNTTTLQVGADVTRHILTDLDSNRLYHVTLQPLYGDREGGESEVEQKTESLTAPTVDVIEENVTSVRLRWSSINYDASSWTINYFPKGRRRQSNTLGVSGESNIKTISGLFPSTIYKFEVAGNVGTSGIELTSPSGKARAKTKPLLPPTVTCYETSHDAINVSINDIMKEVTILKIYVHPQEDPDQAQAIEIDSKRRKHSFENLLPGTTYEIASSSYVLGSDANIYSSPNSSQACSTKPIPPGNLILLDSDLNSLTFEFDHPAGGFDRFIGHCISKNDESEKIKATFSVDLQMKCDGLQPSTLYEVQLATIYKNWTSEQISSEESTLTPPPSELKLTNATTHSLIATWTPPDGLDVEFYYVTFNFSDENVDVKIVNGNITSTTIDNLEPGTLYTVQIQAEVAGEQSFVARNFATIKPEILDLKIDAVGYTTINVSWTPSSVPQIKSYCLKYAPAYLPTYDHDLVLPPETASYFLTDLETATRYKLTLNGHYAVTQSGEVEQFVTTLALPPIGPLNFTRITESSFVASWSPPETNPNPVGYIVTYVSDGGHPITIDGVNSTSSLFDELHSETIYDVTVRACYPDDLISQSIEGKISTLASTPSTCSCSTYLNAQSKMQTMMQQMMNQIVRLDGRVRNFSLASRRQEKNRRLYNRRRKKKTKSNKRRQTKKNSKT